MYDHLTIDKCRFTWENGRLLAGQQDGVDKLKSMFRHDFSVFVSGLIDPPQRQVAENGGGARYTEQRH